MDINDNTLDQVLRITSPAFGEGASVPIQHTCKGPNVSPPLAIAGVPAGAKNLALIMHDPDAVSGDFVHWLVWNIPVNAEAIAANSVPAAAVQGINGGGKNQYMGPCPPSGTGTHRYMFELFALDKILDLLPGSSRAQLEAAMGGHVLAQHVLTGIFNSQDVIA